jgi:hypothetical protein
MSIKSAALLEQMAEEYGGRVRTDQRPTEERDRKAALCRWVLYGKDAERGLQRIGPHLRLKAEQAALVLEASAIHAALPRTKSGRPMWTSTARAETNAVRLRIMALNRKGPTAAPVRPVGGVWRTPQGSLEEPSGARFSGTWPRSASMSSGTVYRRQPSAPRTSVTGSSPLLPTPMARTTGGTEISGKSRTGGPMLQEALVVLLPTPTAHERTLTPRQVDHGRQLDNELNRLPKLLKTPTAAPHNQPGANGGENRKELVKLLPTPTRTDATQIGSPSQESNPVLPTALRLLSTGPTTDPPSSDGSEPSAGVLENPCFREWLMGLPEGWSDPDCPLSATEFRSRSATSLAATSKNLRRSER